MDIDVYKKYLRDLELADSEIESLIIDVLHEIFSTTMMLRKTIGFDLLRDVDEYDIEALFYVNEQFSDNVTNIEFSLKDGYVDEIVDDNKKCEVDETVEVKYGVEDKQFKDTFLHTLDILYVKRDEDKYYMENNFVSVINSWFTEIRDNYFVKKDKLNEKLDLFKDCDRVHMLAVCSYMPHYKNINEKLENVIKHTLIAGLKYYANDLYNNVNNIQVVELYNRRYYYHLKQLRNEYGHIMFKQNSKYKSIFK